MITSIQFISVSRESVVSSWLEEMGYNSIHNRACLSTVMSLISATFSEKATFSFEIIVPFSQKYKSPFVSFENSLFLAQHDIGTSFIFLP